MKAGIYLRVSTEDQNPDNQVAPLEALCAARGWEVHAWYKDVITGKTLDRVRLNDFLHDARVGKFQVAVFWSWDRLTRKGIRAAFRLMDSFKAWGVEWESLQESYLSSGTDPRFGDLLMAVMAWAASQERNLISERTIAGMNLKRSQGVHVGRPKGSRDKRPRKARAKKGSPMKPTETLLL